MPELSTATPARKSMASTVMILMIIASLGVVVWWNYKKKVEADLRQGRLPIKSKVETDPGYWVDENGKARQLKELDGKVVVWSYFYTTCSTGCSSMADSMQELQKEFGSNPKFQLVSIGLYPEHDRPEFFKEWKKAREISGDNWWFLTTAGSTEADGNAARQWVQKSLYLWAMKNSPEKIAKNPADVWVHAQVMIVTDGHGNVRTPTYNDTFWWPHHETFGTWFPRPIREDIEELLKEAEKETKPEK